MNKLKNVTNSELCYQAPHIIAAMNYKLLMSNNLKNDLINKIFKQMITMINQTTRNITTGCLTCPLTDKVTYIPPRQDNKTLSNKNVDWVKIVVPVIITVLIITTIIIFISKMKKKK